MWASSMWRPRAKLQGRFYKIPHWSEGWGFAVRSAPEPMILILISDLWAGLRGFLSSEQNVRRGHLGSPWGRRSGRAA